MPRLVLHTVHHSQTTETALINIFTIDHDPTTKPELLQPYDDFSKEEALIEQVREKVFPIVKKGLRLTQYRAMEVIGGEMGDRNVYINVYPHPNMTITDKDIKNLKNILEEVVEKHNKDFENKNISSSQMTHMRLYKPKREVDLNVETRENIKKINLRKS